MASLKVELRSARDCFRQAEYRQTLQHCKAALKINVESYDAFLLIGKSAYKLAEPKQADAAYRRAIQINASGPAAWMGLAELADASNEFLAAIEANEQLLLLAEAPDSGIAEKSSEFRSKLAAAYQSAGQLPQAEEQLVSLLESSDARDGAETATLELITKLGHVQLALAAASPADSGAGSRLSATVQRIVGLTQPEAHYLVFHEQFLQNSVAAIRGQSPGSTERIAAQAAALSLSHRLLSVPECLSSTTAFDTWVWLTEEAAEESRQQQQQQQLSHAEDQSVIAAARLSADDLTVCHAVHSAPRCATARSMLGLVLWRRLHAGSDAPSKAASRQRVIKALVRASSEQNHSGVARVALAELQLEDDNASGALAAVASGMGWVRSRREGGYGKLTGTVLALRLTAARAHLALGQIDEGDAAVKKLSGHMDYVLISPLSDHLVPLRQCVERLTAQLLAARGQHTEALAAFTLLAEQHSDQHWAHGDYGVALFQGEQFEAARANLEAASKLAAVAGPAATDAEVAAYSYWRGRVLWVMGGEHRSQRSGAHAAFLAAAAVAGARQAESFAWLGRYYREVASDAPRGRKCLQRALALDPTLDEAGDSLWELLAASGSEATADALALEITSRAPTALWAWRRRAFAELAGGAAAAAVVSFQAVLRGRPGDAASWEGLGAAYEGLGRLTAGLKAYLRASQLQPGRLYALLQAGTIQLSLGAVTDAVATFQAALRVDGRHPAALLGVAQTLLASARAAASIGAVGMAAADLARAMSHASKCAQQEGRMHSAWKLLGDVHLQHHSVTPAAVVGSSPVQKWEARVSEMRAARRAYAKALHLRPDQGSAWGDAAAAFYLESQLRRATAQSAVDAEHARVLRSTAERLTRGGLRLSPASPSLWTALGCCAQQEATQEVALQRALQLDPRSAQAWTALGRLYAEAGAGAGDGLAASCYMQARSHDPLYAAPWEAMAAMAGSRASGHVEKSEDAEFARRLPGAGPEALLGAAEGAIRAGRSADGAVYAAARQAVEVEPLNAAAQHILGLAAEARGSLQEAVTAFRMAASLLSSNDDGTMAERNHSMLRIQPMGEQPVAAVVAINLARVLTKLGAGNESEALYSKLGVVLDSSTWLTRAHAYTTTGDLAAAVACIASAIDSATSGEALTAAVAVRCRLHIAQGSSRQALLALQQLLPQLEAAHASPESLQSLWLLVLAAAASKGGIGAEDDLAQTRLLLQDWAPVPDALFAGRIQAVLGAGSQAASKGQLASRQLGSAVHLCPSSLPLRVALARAAITASPGSAPAARRLCMDSRLTALAAIKTPARHLAPQRQAIGPPDHAEAAPEAPTGAVVRAALLTRAAGAIGLGPVAGQSPTVIESKAALAWWHAEPSNTSAQYAAALLALQAAAGDGLPGSFRRALAAARSALSIAERRQSPVYQRVRLSLAVSEAFLGSGGSGEKAAQHAQQGLDLAQEHGLDTAAAHMQIGRCLEKAGDTAAALVSYKHAASKGSGAATLDAARLSEDINMLGAFADAEVEAALERLCKGEEKEESPGGDCEQGMWRQRLKLQEAIMLSSKGSWASADAAAEAARLMDDASTNMRHGAPGGPLGRGQVSEVVQAAIGLIRGQQEQARGEDGLVATVSQVRRTLANVLSQSGAINPMAHVLAARAEELGNSRRKDERIREHLTQALASWPQPVPSKLVEELAALKAEDVTPSADSMGDFEGQPGVAVKA